MYILNFQTFFLVAFAIIFYKLAEIEKAPKFLWTGLSIIVSLIVRLLSWGVVALILGQIALFFGIGIFRAIFLKKK